MRSRRLLAVAAATVAAFVLGACSSSSDSNNSSTPNSPAPAASPSVTPGADGTLVVEHAFGTTEIPANPERIATVAWANHEVPLALGIVPVGMAAANFADEDGDGLLPWVKDKLEELGAETPVLFDESDGIDFEAVANTKPDVILAAYSGLSEEDYKLLSEIAPTVAFPETPWTTSWRDMILLNSAGMNKVAEGEALLAELDALIQTKAAEHPILAESSAMFLTHVDVTNLSVLNFYTPLDTRVAYFADLGLKTPKAIGDFQPDAANPFAGSVSAETADVFNDVDVIVTYATPEMLEALKADPLMGLIPAIKNDAVVALDWSDAKATASNPTPLQLPYLIDWYIEELVAAANKSA